MCISTEFCGVCSWKLAQDVRMVWKCCASFLAIMFGWFWGFIPTCACFTLAKFVPPVLFVSHFWLKRDKKGGWGGRGDWGEAAWPVKVQIYETLMKLSCSQRYNSCKFKRIQVKLYKQIQPSAVGVADPLQCFLPPELYDDILQQTNLYVLNSVH